jgi:hypothetical protein
MENPAPRYGGPRQPRLFAHLFSSMDLHSVATKRGIMAEFPTRSVCHSEKSDRGGEGGTEDALCDP